MSDPPIPIPQPPKKPTFDPSVLGGSSDLLGRLNSFLPQLEKANAELEKAREEGTLDERILDNADEDAEGGYIEMNLGLGVLEEKTKGKKRSHDEADIKTREDSSDEDSDSSDESSSEDEEAETDILGALLGKQSGEKDGKPTIQVIESNTNTTKDNRADEKEGNA